MKKPQVKQSLNMSKDVVTDPSLIVINGHKYFKVMVSNANVKKKQSHSPNSWGSFIIPRRVYVYPMNLYWGWSSDLLWFIMFIPHYHSWIPEDSCQLSFEPR